MVNSLLTLDEIELENIKSQYEIDLLYTCRKFSLKIIKKFITISFLFILDINFDKFLVERLFRYTLFSRFIPEMVLYVLYWKIFLNMRSSTSFY